MNQMGQPGAVESDQKIVVYIFDDVVEFGGEAVQRDLLPAVLPAFMMAATPDTDCGLRQGAVYGIGVSGKYSSEGASIANGSTVVDISIKPSSFKLVPMSSPRSPLSKTPKHVIFLTLSTFCHFYHTITLLSILLFFI